MTVLLLLVGVNIVVGETGFENLRGYAGARPSTELRVVLDTKNVVIGGAAVKQDEAISFGNALTQNIVRSRGLFSALREIGSHENIDRNWLAGKDDARSMQSFVGMPDTKIANRWFLIFLVLMLASAAHVVDYLFKLADAWSNRLWW